MTTNAGKVPFNNSRYAHLSIAFNAQFLFRRASAVFYIHIIYGHKTMNIALTNVLPLRKIAIRFFSLLFLIVLNHGAFADPISIPVSEFVKDPDKVTALHNAFEKMRANGNVDNTSPTFRTSLTYWANTHGYFGKGGHSTDMNNWVAQRFPDCLDELDEKTCKKYYDTMKNSVVPDDGFTIDVWGTCQHGNLNFLPWHRMYMHFFTETLRTVGGDKNLELPYWNYYGERSRDGKGLALPKLVRGPEAGTLYNAQRTPGLNTYTVAIDPESASAEQAFDFTKFVPFSNELQSQPHGAIHCAVGQSCVIPDMGFVPIAGLDPAFYMHHANIDRLWQCWLDRKANGATIDLAWAKANLGMPDSWYDTRYTFANEHGKKVTMTIADVFIPGVITTQYDNTANCDEQLTPTTKNLLTTVSNKTALLPHKALGKTRKTKLRGKNVTASLKALSKRKHLRLDAIPDTTSEPGRSYLLLDDVEYIDTPAVSYKIFLSSKSNPKKKSYIATFNLFGVGEHSGPHGDHSQTQDLIYDVTDEIIELNITTAADLTVQFEPTNFTLTPVKEDKSNDGINIGAIRIETVPASQ